MCYFSGHTQHATTKLVKQLTKDQRTQLKRLSLSRMHAG